MFLTEILGIQSLAVFASLGPHLKHYLLFKVLQGHRLSAKLYIPMWGRPALPRGGLPASCPIFSVSPKGRRVTPLVGRWAQRRSQNAQLSPILPPLGEAAHTLLWPSVRPALQRQTLTGLTPGVRREHACWPGRPQPCCPGSVVVVIKVMFTSASATVLSVS